HLRNTKSSSRACRAEHLLEGCDLDRNELCSHCKWRPSVSGLAESTAHCPTCEPRFPVLMTSQGTASCVRLVHHRTRHSTIANACGCRNVRRMARERLPDLDAARL